MLHNTIALRPPYYDQKLIGLEKLRKLDPRWLTSQGEADVTEWNVMTKFAEPKRWANGYISICGGAPTPYLPKVMFLEVSGLPCSSSRSSSV